MAHIHSFNLFFLVFFFNINVFCVILIALNNSIFFLKVKMERRKCFISCLFINLVMIYIYWLQVETMLNFLIPTYAVLEFWFSHSCCIFYRMLSFRVPCDHFFFFLYICNWKWNHQELEIFTMLQIV